MQQVAERRQGERNKIEAGGSISQWIFRISAGSESKRKENRRGGRGEQSGRVVDSQAEASPYSLINASAL